MTEISTVPSEAAADTAQAPFHDLQQFVALPRLAGLAMAPDGSRLVTTVATLNPKRNGFVSAVWEIDPTGGAPARRLTRSSKGERSPAFTAAGDLLFLSARPDPDAEEKDDAPAALWLLPAGGGEARVVGTRPGGIDSVAAATGAGTLIATSATLPGAVSAEDDEERRKARTDADVNAILHAGYPVRYWDHDLGPAEPRLLAGETPADDGTVAWADLTPAPGHALFEVGAGAAITPDGSTVVTAWRVDDPEGATREILVRVDVATGDRTTLADDPDHDFVDPLVSPDGRTVAAVRYLRTKANRPPRVDAVLVGRPAGQPGRPHGRGRPVPAHEGRPAAAGRRGPRPGRRRGGHRARAGLGPPARRHALDARRRRARRRRRRGRPLAPLPRRGARRRRRAPHRRRRGVHRSVGLARRRPRLRAAQRDRRAAGAGPPRCVDARPAAHAPAVARRRARPPGNPHRGDGHGRGRQRPASVARAPGRRRQRPGAAAVVDPRRPAAQLEQLDVALEPMADGRPRLRGPPARPRPLDRLRAGVHRPRLGELGRTAVHRPHGADGRRRGALRHRRDPHRGDGRFVRRLHGELDRRPYGPLRRDRHPREALGPRPVRPDHGRRVVLAGGDDRGDGAGQQPAPVRRRHHDADARHPRGQDYRVPIGEALRLWWDLVSRREDPEDQPHRFLYFPDEHHWILKPQHSVVWYETVFGFLAHHLLGEEFVVPDRLR